VGRAERIKYLLLGFCFFLSYFTMSFTDQILYSASLAFSALNSSSIFCGEKNKVLFSMASLNN